MRMMKQFHNERRMTNSEVPRIEPLRPLRLLCGPAVMDCPKVIQISPDLYVRRDRRLLVEQLYGIRVFADGTIGPVKVREVEHLPAFLSPHGRQAERPHNEGMWT